MKKKLDEKRTNFHFSSLSHVYLEFSTLCQGNSLRSIDNKTVKSFPKKKFLMETYMTKIVENYFYYFLFQIEIKKNCY